MDSDICFEKNNMVFNYRVAGVIKKNDKLLVQKSTKVKHATFLGGRCNLGEDSKKTIIREIKEETGFDVKIVKEIGMIENFFTSSYDGRKYHEILVIYELEFLDKKVYDLDQINSIEGNKSKYLNFVWMSIDDLKKSSFHPLVLLDIINNKNFAHLINYDTSDKYNKKTSL